MPPCRAPLPVRLLPYRPRHLPREAARCVRPRLQAFSTWEKSSSTGVERPKMDTATRNLFFS